MSRTVAIVTACVAVVAVLLAPVTQVLFWQRLVAIGVVAALLLYARELLVGFFERIDEWED